jgi:hypothetical protein
VNNKQILVSYQTGNNKASASINQADVVSCLFNPENGGNIFLPNVG